MGDAIGLTGWTAWAAHPPGGRAENVLRDFSGVLMFAGMVANIETWQRHEIPGRVAVVAGSGSLAKIVVTSGASHAEIYAQGAQVTHFQKAGEPPLLFLSRKSWFAPGQAIRGGVPICFPWFGGRAGEPAHGFARTAEWELIRSAAGADGTVTLRFALPALPGREAWKSLRTEFAVTVGETLTLELATTNEACDQTFELENCLHAYFQAGDIGAVSISGLQNATYLDNATGGHGERKIQTEPALHITRETNRLYLGTRAAVEIRDERFRRVIRVEKHHSESTVVWNPWTTQKLPDDFDPAEHQQMVCVESGNVKENRISLAPGQAASLKTELKTRPL
jgi:glucose-6-phosphate 1-epimerase